MVYINVFHISGHLFTCLVKMRFVWTLSIYWLLFWALQVVYEMLHEKSNKHRLRVVLHFSSGIVEWGKREHAWKSPHVRKGDTWRGERKMRDYRQSPRFWPFTADWFWSVKFVSPSKSIKFIQWESFPHFSLSPRHMSPFLTWGDFHARSRFPHSTIPEEKWGTTRSLNKAPYVKLLSTKPWQFLWSHHLMISSTDSKVVEPFHSIGVKRCWVQTSWKGKNLDILNLELGKVVSSEMSPIS